MRAPIGNLAFLPVSVAGFALAVRAARTDPALRRPWSLIAAAFASILAGDAIWSFIDLVRHADPYPSAADPFYLAFYPLMLAGLLAMPAAKRRRGETVKFALDAATILVGAGMFVWHFVVRPVVTAGTPGTAETFLSLAYPSGDLVLVFVATVVLLRRPNATVRTPVAMLAAGIGLFVVADIAYSGLSMGGTYATGDWPDALWMAAQCAFAAAAAVQVRRASQHRIAERDDTPARRPFSLLPYAAILVGYGLLFGAARPSATTRMGSLLLGAIALTALVIARQVTVMFENARLMTQLHDLARTDDLTGLFTRRAFLELAGREWERSRRYERPLCALAIDVDRFKQVNDSLGHATGDDVLASVARRIRLSLRVTDVLGRTGGDEFVAVLPDTSVYDATALVERLRGLMSLPVETIRGPVFVTVSIGLTPADGCRNLNGFLGRADAALYEAKQDGRDCVRMLVAG